jgi:acyl-coenzyme A thioesterase PaaI-like protein
VVGFGDATKVAQDAGATTFAAQLDPQWTVIGRPHGGYLVAVLARAASAALAGPETGSRASATGHVDPLAVTTHFLASPVCGPASVRVTVLRAGRSMSQVRATLEQDGTACVEALLTMGRLDPASAAYWAGEPAIVLPDPSLCVRGGPPDGGDGMYHQIDLLLDPASTGYLRGEPDSSGEIRGWFGFADDTPLDPVALLLVADVMPPASLTINRSGWVPTLELTAYVRAVPAPGPLRIRQRARLIEHADGAPGGLMDEVCDVWDSRGRIVCQATQLASVRFRR